MDEEGGMEWRAHPEVRAFVNAGQAFQHLVAFPEPRGVWHSDMLSRMLAFYAAGLALLSGSVEEAEMEHLAYIDRP